MISVVETALPIAIDHTRLAEFCRRWNVSEFSFFGSVLTPDFGPSSDIDVLITFGPDDRSSLWDLIRMRDELATMFGRPVDLVEAKALSNPYRRERILSTARRLYAA